MCVCNTYIYACPCLFVFSHIVHVMIHIAIYEVFHCTYATNCPL